MKIPAIIRFMVWEKYMGKSTEGKCYCCKHITISHANFECGHIVAASKGGKATVDNLRPVCSPCNKSMGVTNMHEFMEQYELGKDVSANIQATHVSSKHQCIHCDKYYSSATYLQKHMGICKRKSSSANIEKIIAESEKKREMASVKLAEITKKREVEIQKSLVDDKKLEEEIKKLQEKLADKIKKREEKADRYKVEITKYDEKISKYTSEIAKCDKEIDLVKIAAKNNSMEKSVVNVNTANAVNTVNDINIVNDTNVDAGPQKMEVSQPSQTVINFVIPAGFDHNALLNLLNLTFGNMQPASDKNICEGSIVM